MNLKEMTEKYKEIINKKYTQEELESIWQVIKKAGLEELCPRKVFDSVTELVNK